MRCLIPRRGEIALVLATLLAPLWPTPAAARVFEFLYIEANEGRASGGHAAIRFDKEVFHFQHAEPGLLRISRDDFPGFRFVYGYQENRAIEGHRIEVSDEVYGVLRDAFNRRLLIQNQQFTLLNGLRDDRRLLADLKRASATETVPAGVELKALGYFVKDYRYAGRMAEAAKADGHLARLKTVVAAEYGPDFLDRKRQETWRRLFALRPSLSEAAPAISEERFEPSVHSFSRRYEEQLLNLAALDVLEAGLAPRAETLLTVESPTLALSATAIAKLAAFRQTLFADLLKLMQSERSDWGYPLLVGMARLQALELSIRSGRLVVLDRFRPDGGNDKAVSIDIDDLPAAARHAELVVGRAVDRLGNSTALDERGYGELEVGAATLSRTQASVQDRQSLTLQGISSTPSLAAKADLVPLPITTSELEAYERLLKSRLDAYADKLQALYRYELLNRNCVTEIFRIVNASLGREFAAPSDVRALTPEAIRQTSEHLLGGYIDDRPLNVVPFAAFDQVGSRYRLQSSYRLAPYREQQIERQYRSSDDDLVDLAESNTLTSSIYHWHGEDAAFLFFTQDTIWPRPVLGGANLAVALGQALYGVLAMPWDAGENLRKSLKGIGVSLPELFFFNIRKGSFPNLLPGLSVTDGGE